MHCEGKFVRVDELRDLWCATFDNKPKDDAPIDLVDTLEPPHTKPTPLAPLIDVDDSSSNVEPNIRVGSNQ